MALFVENCLLLVHTFFMDGFKDAFYTGGVHAQRVSLGAALFENFIKAVGLHDIQAVKFLVLAYLTADAHPFGQQVNKLTVNLVNLITQGR